MKYQIILYPVYRLCVCGMRVRAVLGGGGGRGVSVFTFVWLSVRLLQFGPKGGI